MKKNAKAGNFSLLAVFACMMVISMTAETQAASVFPFAVGYDASYSANQDGSTWTCKMQITGTEKISGRQWMIMQLVNWGDEQTAVPTDFSCTSTTLMVYGINKQNSKPFTYPVFKELPVGSSWSYTNNHGYPETATIVSIGELTVPAGTFTNVYQVHYSATYHDEDMYWQPGVGLIQNVDNAPSSGPAVTRQLISSPVQDILLGTWSGSMTIVYPSPSAPAVETGNVQVIFNSTGSTEAYTGTLYWASSIDSSSLGPLNITAIRGPFDPNLLHITSAGYVILGQLRLITVGTSSYWVLDIHGSDTSTGNTSAGLGLIWTQ